MARRKKKTVAKSKKKIIPKLYHGTLRTHLKEIEKEGGLKVTTGWGGQNTVGVFLSKDFETALLWAKIAYMVQTDQGFNPYKFDRLFPRDQAWEKIVILEVDIPDEFESLLYADMEQAEDVGFREDERNWRASLKKIGDVRFDSPIPTSWLTQVSP